MKQIKTTSICPCEEKVCCAVNAVLTLGDLRVLNWLFEMAIKDRAAQVTKRLEDSSDDSLLQSSLTSYNMVIHCWEHFRDVYALQVNKDVPELHYYTKD